MSPLYYSVFPSPIGLIYAAATEKGVCRLTYDVSEDEYETDLMNRYGREVIYTSNAPILASVEDQIERYFMS